MSILKNLIDGLTIIHDKLDKAGKADAKLIALGFRVDRGWVGNLINNYTVEYCF